ncbi:Cut9-interacting protein scn1 [Lithohypha guttulata]|uniref:Cut9-interacting protein scn1 n=1 Tax=Lithohypha guttulata TaxID=1690604 RepID=A0AAN7T1B1_9EURO|nr:Cut9-interacting protein scn1 [Lithohypha guttulata]
MTSYSKRKGTHRTSWKKPSMEEAKKVGLFDAHCHPTDIMSATPRISEMNAKALTVMSTRAQDQDLVLETAKQYPVPDNNTQANGDKQNTYIVPSFGWHPWFTYQIFDDRGGQDEVDATQHYRGVLTPEPDKAFLKTLPKPRKLSSFLHETEMRLQEFPSAVIGEIGLDRSFRVPHGDFKSEDDSEVTPRDMTAKTGGLNEGEYTPGSREGRPLSPYHVKLEHQKVILKAQLELAAKHNRAVSVHSVATHGAVFDLLQSLWKGHEKPSKSAKKKQNKDAANAPLESDYHSVEGGKPLYPPRICMHSYSGPADALKQFLGARVPADIFFSFSELINFGSHNSEKAVEVIKAVPNEQILIESDLHCAGERMDKLLEDILTRVCEIKDWSLPEGAEQLKKNWHRFVFGVAPEE